ncbi:MAG: BrnA antitoxin family protein [Dehalococcoidia bacterium]
MKKMDNVIPAFKDADEEREFWATHSPLDYFDSSKFKRAIFPNLKPSMKSISIRLPEDILAELKTIANKKDVPYQSLAKIYLARQIALERNSVTSVPKRRKVKTGASKGTSAGLDKPSC